ncbi:MAG TPA: helix-turn-helix domain-containing protein [Blastocatellia bacterium]|nr:helix-turn-helix domain-containing protein [Blastocatellia bacterium]
MLIPKAKAMDILHCSKRSLERYTQQGKLSVIYKGQAAHYEKDAVLALKAAMNEPVHKAQVVANTNSTALVRHQPSLPMTQPDAQLLALVAHLSQSQALPLRDKLGFTVKEAAAITSLPMSALRVAIRAKKLKASKQGGRWNVRRADLEKWYANT